MQEEGREPWGIWKTVHIPPGQSFNLFGGSRGIERGPQRRETPGTHEEASLDGRASGAASSFGGWSGERRAKGKAAGTFGRLSAW